MIPFHPTSARICSIFFLAHFCPRVTAGFQRQCPNSIRTPAHRKVSSARAAMAFRPTGPVCRPRPLGAWTAMALPGPPWVPASLAPCVALARGRLDRYRFLWIPIPFHSLALCAVLPCGCLDPNGFLRIPRGSAHAEVHTQGFPYTLGSTRTGFHAYGDPHAWDSTHGGRDVWFFSHVDV